MKATILYNEGRDHFGGYDPETAVLRQVYEVEVPDADDIMKTLERIWRAGNHVDGSDIEQVPDGVRSMSMGDVVWTYSAEDLRGRMFSVEMLGFVEVDRRTAMARLDVVASERVIQTLRDIAEADEKEDA